MSSTMSSESMPSDSSVASSVIFSASRSRFSTRTSFTVSMVAMVRSFRFMQFSLIVKVFLRK